MINQIARLIGASDARADCKEHHCRRLCKATLILILQENIAKEACVMTDEASQYHDIGAGKVFDAHGWTNHSAGEHVNLEGREMHTNTV